MVSIVKVTGASDYLKCIPPRLPDRTMAKGWCQMKCFSFGAIDCSELLGQLTRTHQMLPNELLYRVDHLVLET